MISKEDLLKNFANEDKDSVIRIYDNLMLAKNKDIPVFSKNFCPPNIWSYFVENFNNNSFIVEADGAYDEAEVPVYEDIANYITTSMEFVGRCPVEIEIVDKEHLPQSVFEEIVINIPSLRIDNYVSKLANVSRAKAIELMQNNKVSVNYCKIKEKSKEIQENNVITISGIGKFRTSSIVGNTKSGKNKVVIKKYI